MRELGSSGSNIIFEGETKPCGAGTLKTKPVFFGEEKAPAGAVKTKPEFWGEKKAPAGALERDLTFLEENKPLRAR